MRKNELTELTDKELMQKKWEAEEMQCGRLIKKVQQEITRRNKEQ